MQVPIYFKIYYLGEGCLAGALRLEPEVSDCHLRSEFLSFFLSTLNLGSQVRNQSDVYEKFVFLIFIYPKR